MKFSSINTALCSVFNYASQSQIYATSHKQLFGVKTSLSAEDIKTRISTARKIKSTLESSFTGKDLALIKFKFGYSDLRGEDGILKLISEISYHSDIAIGSYIAFEWRGDRPPIGSTYTKEVMECLGIGNSRAREIIRNGIEKLENHYKQLMNESGKAYQEIKTILTKNEVLI